MQEGDIVEAGTHNELLEKGGVYAGLVAAQELKKRGGEVGEIVDAEAEEVAELKKVKQATTEDSKAMDGVATGNGDKTYDDSPVDEHAKEGVKGKVQVKRPMNWKRLFSLNSPEWPLIVFGTVCASINGVIMPLFAIVFSSILSVFGTTDVVKLRKDSNFWSGMFVVLAVVAFLVNLGQIACFTISGERFTRRLRNMSFKALIYQNIAYFDDSEHSTGVLTANLAEDASMVQGLTGQLMGSVVQTFSNFGAGIIIAFVYGFAIIISSISGTTFANVET